MNFSRNSQLLFRIRIFYALIKINERNYIEIKKICFQDKRNSLIKEANDFMLSTADKLKKVRKANFKGYEESDQQLQEKLKYNLFRYRRALIEQVFA